MAHGRQHVLCHSFSQFYSWKFPPIMQSNTNGVLWDLSFLHMFTLTNILIIYVSFFLTYTTDPGTLSLNPKNKLQGLTRHLRALYESNLESQTLLSKTPQEEQLSLCHSCHVSRPKRSKHCRIRRKCVLLFDHYCPFVGTTVGLYNYRYFYLFLLSLTLAELGFICTYFIYISRVGFFTDKKVLVLGFICSLFVLPALGMLLYHTQLVLKNLTTNEHQNLRKYSYLRDDRGYYKKKFDKGFLGNLYSRFCPKVEGLPIEELKQDKERRGLLGRDAAAVMEV